MEQLDCSSSGSAARKARGSKRSKDSKYRSSLPRKIEQPDIYSDETLFDTVDATNLSKKTQLMNNKSFQPIASEQIISNQIKENEKRNSLTPGSPEKVKIFTHIHFSYLIFYLYSMLLCIIIHDFFRLISFRKT